MTDLVPVRPAAGCGAGRTSGTEAPGAESGMGASTLASATASSCGAGAAENGVFGGGWRAATTLVPRGSEERLRSANRAVTPPSAKSASELAKMAHRRVARAAPSGAGSVEPRGLAKISVAWAFQ